MPTAAASVTDETTEPRTTMDKTFDPAAIEPRIAARWEAAGAFRAGRPDRAAAEPYCIMIPPPNVTGSLHMGHAFTFTLQDILCRFERMRGKDVLWQPGTDHAGIATQMVVERQLMERQEPGRRAMGREAFLKRVWAWKEESGGVIVNQLERLGASCDWSRLRFTLDAGLSAAVRKVFVRLYEEGLIYKDKRLVNWDPALQTAVSDLEVQQVEVKGNLWHFKYPIEGTEGEFIVVATTRPETMLGDTAVAVSPQNERLQHLIGRHAILPLVGRRIPIIGDDYADPEKGTGAVKITPAHDFNDFSVGKRHKLALINIFDAEAQLVLVGNDDFLEGLSASSDLTDVLALDRMDRFFARKKIVAMMDERGLLDKVEAHGHTVPHGDRSGVVIEPWLTDQWYVNAKTLAQPALKMVREGKTTFVPKNWEKTYFEWLDNIEPWCISRQLWWGHRIPAWYGPEIDKDGFEIDGSRHAFVANDEREALAKARSYYPDNIELDIDETDEITGAPTVGTVSDGFSARRKVSSIELARDPDVLDTWFSSGLWPFSTLGWPDPTPELKRYYPTSVLVTGFDIIFFWVARMMMMGLHFMQEVPFRDVYIHALVRDATGAKMSKSKGNVIDPLHLMSEYGADALRFTLAAMAVQGRDIKLASSRVEGYRNFATKLWSVTRFAAMNGCERTAGFDPKAITMPLGSWVLGELSRTTADVTAAIEAYRFNDAASSCYRFVWNVFCDWYVELVKPVLLGEDEAPKPETRATTAFVLDQSLKLLHPFMPFLTEELWDLTGATGPERETLLALAPWPALDGLEAPDAEAEIGWVVDLISEVRSVRNETGVQGGTVPLVLVEATADVRARVERWGDSIRRLARLSQITFADVPPKGSVQTIVRGTLVMLPLEGLIDVAVEQARLAKDIAKEKAEVQKLDAKLGNPNFVSRAPEEVIEEHRERRETMLERIAKMEAAVQRLKQAF